MRIVKMDRKFAEEIIRNFDKEGIEWECEYERCEKCGALYMPSLGHDCDNVVSVPVHEVGEEE